MPLVPDSFDLVAQASRKRVHVVSLGCPKNRVDSELMIGLMKGGGYDLTDAAEEADVIVVNTCAFIESAKVESIDTILDMARYKERGVGRAEKLVVTGCMAQRYGHELATEMPEVDYFLGTNEFKRINEALSGALPDREYISYGSALYQSDEQRVNTIRGGSAYVKISEGCNRVCSFCIIPKIRGKQVSRPIDDVIREARFLGAAGVREINLIAQDLTSYGVDLGNRQALEQLLVGLEEVPGIEWVRLHYAYPWNFTDRLIGILRDSKKVVPYVDMPLQHISDDILRAMRRNVKREAQRELIGRLREIPGMVLRTVFISGFPGETQAHHEELRDWMREVEFDHVGVFTYSKEENTEAAELPDQVAAEVAEERRAELMELQSGISRRKNEARIGQRLRVLVDGVSEEHEYVLEGRHQGQALDIDGVTYLSFEGDDVGPVVPGQFVEVEIDDATEYDLVGVVVGTA
jgi:ribosomal protein S12 methylthiotransferase